MSYVGQIKKGSTTHLVGSTLYGTCSTAAATAAKVGTLSNFDSLVTGVTVHIKFTNANTAASPTLNVNGTGAKPIVKYGTTAAGTSSTASWYAGSVVSLTYDGTSWVMNDFKQDANTTYTAGTGLALSSTTFNHSNSVTALTTEGLRKIKYDAQGHITGSSAVAKTDITALGIPSSDTNNRRGFYGTCSTAAATAAKVVTLGSTTGWELVAGTIVGVKFSATNTAQNPTLNINSSGAKSVWYNTALITTSNLDKAGYASRVIYYMYDGTQWVWIGWSVEENTWQSNTNARAGYVASGASQVNKVWKTNDSGSPAWRDERQFPILTASGTAGTGTINLASRVITQVPLKTVLVRLAGNSGNVIELDSGANAIAVEGSAGFYRVTASVYIYPDDPAMCGVYIKQGTSTSFASATEKASSFTHSTMGGAVNVTQTLNLTGARTYLFLGARVMDVTGKAHVGNIATYLEVQQIG